MIWLKLDPNAHIDSLGFVSTFVDYRDPRPAREQLDEGYRRAAGCTYDPQEGHELVDRKTMTIQYPGDPPHTPLWTTTVRDEEIYVYDYGYVLVIQPDNSFVIARMD